MPTKLEALQMAQKVNRSRQNDHKPPTLSSFGAFVVVLVWTIHILVPFGKSSNSWHFLY